MRAPFMDSEDTSIVKPSAVTRETSLPGPQKLGTGGTFSPISQWVSAFFENLFDGCNEAGNVMRIGFSRGLPSKLPQRLEGDRPTGNPWHTAQRKLERRHL